MVNYQKSCIYKLCCNDLNIKDIYIGSTTNFTKRKMSHKLAYFGKTESNKKCKVYEFIRNNGGWENWIMVEIKKFSCNSKRELHTEERRMIEKFESTLNSVIPTRTQKEYQKNKRENGTRRSYEKEYEKKNKEILKEKKRLYYLKNKEKIKLQQKKYYEKKVGK